MAEKFLTFSREKIKERTFFGPQIRKLVLYKRFKTIIKELEKKEKLGCKQGGKEVENPLVVPLPLKNINNLIL